MGERKNWRRPLFLALFVVVSVGVISSRNGVSSSLSEIGFSASSILEEEETTVLKISTLLGGTPGFSDGCGSDAQMIAPRSMVSTDEEGTFLFLDGNQAVRRLTLITLPVRGDSMGYYTACITTIAGRGEAGYQDGLASQALFNNPTSITRIENPDKKGEWSYLITDTGNSCIRRLDLETDTTPARVITVLGEIPSVGTEEATQVAQDEDTKTKTSIVKNGPRETKGVDMDGVGTEAKLNAPMGILAIPELDIFLLADAGGHVIREVELSNYRAKTALGQQGSTGLSDGNHQSALFNAPTTLRRFQDGAFEIALLDTGNSAIRRLSYQSSTHEWHSATVTGSASGTSGGFHDGDPSRAAFSKPEDIAIIPRSDTNVIYAGEAVSSFVIADTGNSLLRLYDASTGIISTLAGSVDEPGFQDSADDPLAAKFDSPTSLIFTKDGHLLVADAGNDAIRIAYFSSAHVRDEHV